MQAAEQQAAALDIKLRPMQQADQAFIYNAWLNHFRQCLSMPKTAFYDYYSPLINRILAHPETAVVVACHPTNPGLIYGWLCWSQAGRVPLVHYVYVRGGKPNLRRMGVCWALLCEALDIERPEPGQKAAVDVVYTFDTRSARHLAKRARHAEYVPIEEYLR